MRGIEIGIDVLWWQSHRELADICRAVIFLDVLTGARNGDDIQQLEIVEAHRIQQGSHTAAFRRLLDPLVELLLRQA